MRTIKVDTNGIDREGNDYGHYATDEAVRNGYAENETVRLKYPDGSTVIANDVLLTPKGLERMRVLIDGSYREAGRA